MLTIYGVAYSYCQVRKYVNKQLAQRLRPELTALVSANDAAPGATYVPDAANAAQRAIKNKALGLLSYLGDQGVTNDLLSR